MIVKNKTFFMRFELHEKLPLQFNGLMAPGSVPARTDTESGRHCSVSNNKRLPVGVVYHLSCSYKLPSNPIAFFRRRTVLTIHERQTASLFPPIFSNGIIKAGVR
jgi:hypothetical protein